MVELYKERWCYLETKIMRFDTVFALELSEKLGVYKQYTISYGNEDVIVHQGVAREYYLLDILFFYVHVISDLSVK